MDIFEHRRAQFEQMYNYLQQGNGETHRPIRNANNEDKLQALARLRVIPVRNTHYSIEELTESGYHTDYRLQIFFETLKDALIDQSLSQEEIRDELDEVNANLQDPNMDCPSDGTKGQMIAALNTQRKALQWVLGEYHGEPLHEDDQFA